MIDQKNDNNPDSHKKKGKFSNAVILAACVALAIFISKNPQRFYNILLVIVGFGGVIFVHELGHFAAAKAVGIMVEAFAIGFGPIFLGIKKVAGGFQIRLLPNILHSRDGKSDLALFVPWSSARPGETEYQLRLIPLGGFVKMLGQEDIGADKDSDDPRAFGNKAVWKRAIVISAGVTMNVICGAIVFVIVFARGVELPPAVVGAVLPDKPAARAGISSGDEIISINGKENISFTDLMIASIFADKGEKLALKVRHTDGNIKTYQLEPQDPQTDVEKSKGIRMLGITPAESLTIADIDRNNPDNTVLLGNLEKLGLQPNDEIIEVNNQKIARNDQLTQVLYPEPDTLKPETITLTASRTSASAAVTRHAIEIPMDFTVYPRVSGKMQATLLGMTPRLKISSVLTGRPAQKAGLLINDVILQFGTINNPTLEELQEYCANHNNQSVKVVVQRIENDSVTRKTLEVTPDKAKSSGLKNIFGKAPKPTIGIQIAWDTATPVVAHCRELDKQKPLASLPRGSHITTIANETVNDWIDIHRLLCQHKGRKVAVQYRTIDEQPTQSLTITVPDTNEWIGFAFRPALGEVPFLPFKPLMKQYKGNTWTESLRMGADQTYIFIAQTYLMFRGMFKGTVSAKTASGPVGILKMSYNVVEQRTGSYYFYFMAIISVCIAVFNFLPLPILDGGLIVLLLVEKIKGAPVSIRTQEFLNYAGLALIGGLFLFVTYNDIVKLVTGQL